MLFVSDQAFQTRNLSHDLRNFGLNPQDWKILKERSATYKIQSKRDQDFVFAGRAKRKGARLAWEKIELISV